MIIYYRYGHYGNYHINNISLMILLAELRLCLEIIGMINSRNQQSYFSISQIISKHRFSLIQPLDKKIICAFQSAKFESDYPKYGICKQFNSNTNDFYILMELMEKWKTELFQDQALNRLFDNSISQEDFVLMILQKYNMVQLGEIFSRLTSINQSVSSQLSEHVKNNYQLLIQNLSKNSNEQHQVIVAKMAFIKQLQNQTNTIFQEKIQQIEQLEPEIQRNKTLLSLCEQLKKFQQQIKILNSLIQLTPTMNIIDPFRVSHVLFEIKQMNLSGFKLYQNQVKLLNQVEEAVITKASKKFSDAFTNKSLPELTSCLAIFYNLNRLHQTVELKVNSILKSIAESYKLLFSKTPSISDWRAAIKEDFNYVLQVWLLWQAIQQRDPFQFVHYEELLKDKFPNIFKQFWDKYCDIIEQSLNLQQCQVHVNYPQILDQYVEFMQNFHDSILVFPGAILLNVRITDYFQELQEVIHTLEVNYRIYFQQFLQEQFQTIYQGLNDKKLNIVILSVGSILDFIKSDVETIKDSNCFKFATSKIVSQLVALQQQYATENQNILNYCVLRMLSFHDTPMNHHLDIKQLEELNIQKIDNPLLDAFFQSETKLRKQNIESLINQLQKQ